MKLIGATLFASAFAFAAGCSSGNSSPPRVDDAATNSDGLVAPNRPAPEDDPCARVRCVAGTECVVVDGQATCAPTDASACAAVLCPVNTTCEVIDGVPNCEPIEPDTSACAAVLCPVNTTCEVIDGIPNCEPIEPDAPLCGGFAGLTCPGAGTCVDDPSDNCDPDDGGADCSGICECNVLALCVEGFVFDASPEVCACVESPELDPCATVRCAAGTECVVIDGRASCEPKENPCATVLCQPDSICEVIGDEAVCKPIDAPSGPFCGGFAGVQCPGGGTCVDDPTDSCDPDNGGADCGGTCECNVLALCVEGFVFDPSPEVCDCVEEAEPNPCALVLCPPNSICEVVADDAVCKPIEPSGPFCGGFGGFQCPGAGTCVDDATDSCDPDNGGADCGGICECNVLALCIEGFAFNPSPEVCACVEAPELDPCAVVRCPGGTECVVIDGRASCEPSENPCNLVDCIPDTICRVIDGEPVCIPCD